MFFMKRQRIYLFADGIFVTKALQVVGIELFHKNIHLIIGDGQESVMKINANTNAIMSSDGDGAILWI